MNSKFKLITLSLVALLFTTSMQAQEGLIYGKLTMVDGDVYTGQIRWGKEEAYWTDIFNGTKDGNDNYRYLSREDKEALRDKVRDNNRWGNVWVNWGSSRNEYETTHEFQARFGDISKIEITRRSEVRMTLRNGDEIYVGDGSNDFDTEVRIMDESTISFGGAGVYWQHNPYVATIQYFSGNDRHCSSHQEPTATARSLEAAAAALTASPLSS